jgi:hypothetical protein
MEIQILGPYDYDLLQTCAFCDEFGLHEIDNCPHFVVAFQDGDWHPNLCPPVFSDGFRFNRRELTAALTRSTGIVCKRKRGTSQHPRIEAYFCVDPVLTRTLRENHKLLVVRGGAMCPSCGNSTTVLEEPKERTGDAGTRCAICGEVADPLAEGKESRTEEKKMENRNLEDRVVALEDIFRNVDECLVAAGQWMEELGELIESLHRVTQEEIKILLLAALRERHVATKDESTKDLLLRLMQNWTEVLPTRSDEGCGRGVAACTCFGKDS